MIRSNEIEEKTILPKITVRKGVLVNLLLILFLILLNFRAAVSETINFDPPGQLVEVNGRNMHIHCVGNKSPSIILDSGAGGFSLEWRNIQHFLVKHARVCAYDRAGYGWSDMGSLPRTTKRIAHELHALLENAEIPEPYIIVGHSFGGFTAQYFARRFSDEITGIVLIDSSHEEQVYRLPENGKDVVRRSLHQDRSHTVTKPVLHEHYPKEAAAVAQQLMRRWSSMLTWREEMANYALSSRELRDLYHKPILEIPIAVVSRGKRVWPDTPYGDAMEATWKELQDELNYISNNSLHIIAQDSGHVIHLDEPELVVQAIYEVLEIARQGVEESERLILKKAQ